jgi:putative FmdB family regulatory protein
MPIYEYRCEPCDETYEAVFPISDRDSEQHCRDCSTPLIRICSVPSLKIWNFERKFPNISPQGDGTMSFSSEGEYETYLTSNHLYEKRIDGVVESGERELVSKDGEPVEPKKAKKVRQLVG